MKKISFLLIFLLVVIRIYCQDVKINWYIKPYFSRDYYGNITGDSAYVTLNMKFSSSIPQLVAFDYGQIYSRVFKTCQKQKNETNFESYLLSEFGISQLILENESGFFIPLIDNMIDAPLLGNNCIMSSIDVPNDFNMDIIQLAPNSLTETRFKYPIRYCAMTVCSNNKKLRLLYVQKPNKYLKKLGISERVLISEWFELSSIK
jgi:hypothetical protein